MSGLRHIADRSLVGYLYYDEETGVDLGKFPNLLAWRHRIAALPGWKHPYDLMPRGLKEKRNKHGQECHEKMHIPDDLRYYEKYYFTPGDLGFRSFDTRAGKLGVLVCWDQWYPEGARLTALQGAEILVYPTAIGWHPEEKAQIGERQHAAWETIRRAHAIANGCFVIAINRTGFEPDPKGAAARRHRPRRNRAPAPELAVSARPADRRLRRYH